MIEWISVEDRLPERKEGWDHSERCLVWYPSRPHTNTGEKYGIAYYHYNPPFENVPKWTNFDTLRQDVAYWCPLNKPEVDNQ